MRLSFTLGLWLLSMLLALSIRAAEPTNAISHYDVQSFVINYNPTVFTNAVAPVLAQYTGTNIDLDRIVQAASDVLTAFQQCGFAKANISIAQDQITNGIVTMNIFQGAFPQILISGRSYPGSATAVLAPMRAAAPPATGTNAPTPIKATPHIPVVAYEVEGNTLLPDETLQSIFSKYVGANVSFDEIGNAVKELQLEYHDRGFDTVMVTIPQQRITNAIVKLTVFEGTLAEINVVGNHFYSSNNVMRALPGLTTNMILNSKVFQGQLDQANANQDRQVYPEIRPGPEPQTSALFLKVKDRLPLHAKVEFNNQSSPGTPDLRLNSSAVYNNLWQENHTLGVQYSFSPQQFKQGDQWAWYDQPLVANYSAFYRLPLGNPQSMADAVESRPGTFGFDEATRRFELPPPSGTAELNIYASRSTIDTGVEFGASQTITNIPGVVQISRQDLQQDLTVNNTIGFRLSDPLPEIGAWRSTLSSGLDYKTYSLTSYATNNFTFIQPNVDENGNPLPPTITTDSSPKPVTYRPLQYLPLTLRYDATWHDSLGNGAFGLGSTANLWYSGSRANLDNITGSAQSSGYWFTLTPSLSHDITIHKDWTLSLRADGQWASQPLISNEQFGIGGVASVRGYQEGQVFGDTGWHVSAEQKTPGHIVGIVGGGNPLTVRGSVYVDYAEVYLLDPQGRPGRVSLWGAGFGGVASVGSHWEARLLFSVPLLNASTIEAYQPYFNFSLTAQF